MAWGFEEGAAFKGSLPLLLRLLQRFAPVGAQHLLNFTPESQAPPTAAYLITRSLLSWSTAWPYNAPLFPRHLDNAFRDQNSILTDVTKVGFFLSGLKTYPVTSTFL